MVDDPSLAGENHWTGRKLHGWLRGGCEIDISYRTVVRYLHEQDYKLKVPRPRRRWVKRGSRPEQGYHGGHLRQNVVGAVNPEDGQLVSLIVPHNDTLVFQAFLDTMAKEVSGSGKNVWLVLDNASWHKSKSLDWHHIKPLFLPPYSPDFNPIERFWQHLKSHYMAGFVTKSGEDLADKLEESIRSLLDTPETIKSVCNIHNA